MKKANSDLFRLIKSMNKSEKANFTSLASRSMRKGSTKYLLLFREIDKMEEYDEDTLKSRLAGESILEYLPRAKNYLYAQLLKSLSEQRTQQTVTATLRFLLGQIEVLFEKGLLDQCRSVYRKAYSIATSKKEFAYQLELLAWETRLVIDGQRDYIETQKQLDDNIRKTMSLLETVSRMKQLEQLHHAVFRVFAYHEQIRNITLFDKHMQLFDAPIFRDAKPGNLPLECRRFYFRLCYLKASMLLDSRKACFFAARIAAVESRLLESVPDEPEGYIQALGVLATAQRLNKQFSEAQNTVDSLEAYRRAHGGFTIKVQRILCWHRLIIAIESGDFDSAEAATPQALEFLDSGTATNSDFYRHVFYFTFARLEFLRERFGEALEWLQKIINTMAPDATRKDYYSSTHLLRLLAHYELGNLAVLPSLQQSASNFLRRNAYLFGCESVLLKLCRKLPSLHKGPQTQAVFQEAALELDAVIRHPAERRLMTFFEFDVYLHARAAGYSIAEFRAKQTAAALP